MRSTKSVVVCPLKKAYSVFVKLRTNTLRISSRQHGLWQRDRRHTLLAVPPLKKFVRALSLACHRRGAPGTFHLRVKWGHVSFFMTALLATDTKQLAAWPLLSQDLAIKRSLLFRYYKSRSLFRYVISLVILLHHPQTKV